MFFHVKTKRRGKEQCPNTFRDRCAVPIVKRCIQAQAKWALYLQRKTDGFSTRAKKSGLAIFCLIALGCSFYLVVASLAGNTKKSFDVASIRVPAYSTRTGEENTRPDLGVTKEDTEKIKQLRLYMDSLGTTAVGLRKRDSLLLLRPHLMDTVRAIENLYRVQNQNQ